MASKSGLSFTSSFVFVSLRLLFICSSSVTCKDIAIDIIVIAKLTFRLLQLLRQQFRQPRAMLLNIVAEFVHICTPRLIEINRKTGHETKQNELLDTKCHLVRNLPKFRCFLVRNFPGKSFWHVFFPDLVSFGNEFSQIWCILVSFGVI